MKKIKRVLSGLMALIIVLCCCNIVYADSGTTQAKIVTPIHRYLMDNQVLSYKYSEKDNYYYTDKDKAWQKNFGYTSLYDLAAPFCGMEYDYVRVHYKADGKNWMIQLWKGQYAPTFFGCETGVYTKDNSSKGVNKYTLYDCANDTDRQMMQTTLYHREFNKYQRVFTTPYEDSWWQTGFKLGTLIQFEPADELRQFGTIDFDTEAQAKGFASGLKKCGFKEADNVTAETLDSYAIKDKRVTYCWQNISEAENTMELKAIGMMSIAYAGIAIGYFVLYTSSLILRSLFV